jgi:DNA-binding MarR family transcriptional regulator
MTFNDCICFQLSKTLRQITKAYRKEIDFYKLTHGQFFMIVAIMEEEGLLPSELADKTSQDRSTITGLLDRLEKDGWIERKADDKDRRSLRIYLTLFGSHHKNPVLKIFEKTNHNFINRFTQNEWFQMQDFLSRLEQ